MNKQENTGRTMEKELLKAIRDLTVTTTEVNTKIEFLTEAIKENNLDIKGLDKDLKKQKEDFTNDLSRLKIEIKEIDEALKLRITKYEKIQFKIFTVGAILLTVISFFASITKLLKNWVGV